MANIQFGNGVNLQPSYYNNGEVGFGWKLMKQHQKIKTVRIEIEPNKATQARGWIQQACSRGYRVIATYHKSTVLGTDDVNELMAAATWWKSQYNNLITAPAFYTVQKGDLLGEIAQKYYGDASKYNVIFQANRSILTSPHQIYLGQRLTIPAVSRSLTINIINEWGSHRITARQYADAYNTAIGIIRGFYSEPLVVDVPGWAQETVVAAWAIQGNNTGGVKISDDNIIFSVHIYPSAYVGQKPGFPSQKGDWLSTSDLDALATAAGQRCIVGEFGSGGTGQASWESLVVHAKSKNWPVLGWAWNGDGGTMNMVQPPWSADANPLLFSKTSYFSTIYDKL